MARLLKIFAIFLLVAACSKNDNKLSELVFETANGPVTYQIETAVTKEEMSRGLMNRASLADNSGMLFALRGNTEVAMWMKDTFIPLDMIFVTTDGRIVWLYKNARPQSTTLIRPETDEPLAAVIELNAGDIDKLGLKIGDKVHHELIK